MLIADQKKTPRLRLPIVTDSETVHAGLEGKCAKWERHGWVGSQGALAHQDLWHKLWHSWQLLSDSVSVQWVPSHAGIDGNEQADKCAQHGAWVSLAQVTKAREAREVWQDLGLEEMEEYDEDPPADWDAVDSGVSEGSDEGEVEEDELMSEGGGTDCLLESRPEKRPRDQWEGQADQLI